MASAAKHHKIHGITGLITIISLPFVLFGLLSSAGGRSEGLVNWISSPFGGISLLVFLSAAIWYCKLEFDEVVIDYFDGGLRSFGLLANRIVSLAVWALGAYSIVKLLMGA